MTTAKRGRRLGGAALFAAFPPEWSNLPICKGDKGRLSPVRFIALLQVLPTLPKRFVGVALSLFNKSLLRSDGMVASCLKPILPNLVRVSLKLILEARKQLPELRGNGKFWRLFRNVRLKAQDRTLNVFKRIIVVHVRGLGEQYVWPEVLREIMKLAKVAKAAFFMQESLMSAWSLSTQIIKYTHVMNRLGLASEAPWTRGKLKANRQIGALYSA